MNTHRRNFLTILSLLCLLLAGKAEAQGNKGRVYALIACDMTGNDAERARRSVNEHLASHALSSAMEHVGLRDRLSIKVMEDATPTDILEYFQHLQVTPADTLLFYCNCHGTMNSQGQHMMSFKHKMLYRSRLLKVMKEHNPRLVVIMTDCCARYPNVPANNEDQLPNDHHGTPSGKGPIPAPGKGPSSAGSPIVRHLLLEQHGVVDINSASPGELARGSVKKGNYFTRAWTALLQEPITGIDRNHDSFIEWSEFYRVLQTRTRSIAEQSHLSQTPQAFSLGLRNSQPLQAKR